MGAKSNIRDRIKELRRVKAGDLSPNPRNWRTHPQAQVEAVQGILSEIGYADALLARELPDGTLELVDGHLRQALDPEQEVPVLVLDLDQDEAHKLMVSLDPLAAMAEADKDLLGQLMSEIQTESDGLQAMLDGLAAQEGIDLFEGGAEDLRDAEPQIDRAEELQAEWKTELGQLWEIPGKAGVHRVMCGDSTSEVDVKRLMGGAKAGAVITDPPYGVSFQRGQFISDSKRIASKNVPNSIVGDDRRGEEQREFIAKTFRVLVPWCNNGSAVYMFSAPLMEGCESLFGLVDAGCHVQSQLVWEKNNHVLGQVDYHWKHETCWYGWTAGGSHRWFGERDKFTVLKCDRVQATLHPNEKPTGLACSFLENSTQMGDNILDPFLGSGTTTVAAEQLGRVCYGMEIAPKYVAVILQRLKDLGLEPRLAE